MSTYVRTATVLVRVNTGPPTWWKPSVGFEITEKRMVTVRFGWLRTCVQIAVGSKRHDPDEVNLR